MFASSTAKATAFQKEFVRDLKRRGGLDVLMVASVQVRNRATLLGNLRHWLEDDPDIRRAVAQLPFVNREDICRRP